MIMATGLRPFVVRLSLNIGSSWVRSEGSCEQLAWRYWSTQASIVKACTPYHYR